jgi:diacylglycerol kinase (ATP)
MNEDSPNPNNNNPKPLWLLVVNPVSGGRRKADLIEKAVDFLDRQNISTELFYLTGFQDITHIKHLIKKINPQRLIAVGGDGTCNLVANCVMGTEIEMGTLPAGSANGMALDLGIPRDWESALTRLIDGETKKVDVLHLNDKYISIHLSDAGLNAQLIWRFEQSGQRGGWSYFKEMLRALVRINSFSVRIQCNGKHFKSRAVMLAFANGSRYGSGAVLNPGGSVIDGKFEICLIKPMKWYRMPILAWHLFRGNVNITPEMKIWSTQHAVIRLKRNVLLQADGEILGHHKQIEVKIVQGAVNFIV